MATVARQTKDLTESAFCEQEEATAPPTGRGTQRAGALVSERRR